MGATLGGAGFGMRSLGSPFPGNPCDRALVGRIRRTIRLVVRLVSPFPGLPRTTSFSHG